MNIPYNPPVTIQANGVELVADSFGRLTDPALLLIGGLGDQLISWPEDFCQELASLGCWVIRFDNRDAGLSTRFDGVPVPGMPALIWAYLRGNQLPVPYTLADMAADAAGLLDAFGAAPAHVVGASLGGMIAAMLAIRHPERVKTLTVMMSSTGHPWYAPPRPRSLILFKTPPAGRQGFIAHSLRVRAALRGGGFPMDEAYLREKAGRMVDRSPFPPGTARQMGAILASLRQLRAGLTAIQAPTLVIHGRADPLIPLQHGLHAAQAIPRARLVVIDGLGHELLAGTWDQVVAEITGHASSVSS